MGRQSASLTISGPVSLSVTAGVTTTPWVVTASDQMRELRRALESIAAERSRSRVFSFDVLIREEQLASEISMCSAPLWTVGTGPVKNRVRPSGRGRR
jgi:hypothetical protein